MKRLVLVLNGKGGVGKCFLSVNFVQYLKDRGIHYVAFDTNNENSTLKRFHPEAVFVDLSIRREQDAILGALDETDLLIAVGRASSTDLFLEYLTEIDSAAILAELEARLTLAIPVNHEADRGCGNGNANWTRNWTVSVRISS